MVLDDIKPQPVVGDDLVEVRHQVVLRHHWQRGQRSLVQRVQIDVLQALAVPGGGRLGGTHQAPQLGVPVRGQPCDRPVEPPDQLPGGGHRIPHMAQAEFLVTGHGALLSPVTSADQARADCVWRGTTGSGTCSPRSLTPRR